jgi:L-rhamnonate dehydratase
MDCEYPYLAGDIITKRHEVRDSAMAIPTGPGLGVEVDLDQLERYRVTRVPPAYLDSDRPDWFTVKPSY